MIEGILLGLSAGLIPGPQMMYTISSTLQYGWRQGLISACMPLLAEGPIISLVAFGLATSKMPYWLLTAIALVGGCFLAYMGYSSLRFDSTVIDISNTNIQKSNLKAFLVVFLNPNPYIFWMTTGLGLIQQVHARNGSTMIMVISFFAVFIGINCLMVVLANHIRQYLSTIGYQRLIQGLGIILLIMAGMMIYRVL